MQRINQFHVEFTFQQETMSDSITNKGIPVLYGYCLGRTERPQGEKKQLTALHKEQKGFCGAQTQAAPFKLFHRSHLFGVSRAQKPLGVGRGYLCEFVLCVRTSELFESVNILSENRCQTLVKYLAISSSTPNPSALKDKTERESEGKKEREGNFKISRGL